MRALVIAAALASVAGPGWAANEPAPLSPDPYTASGRFDLPTAANSAYAGRVKLGDVRVDPLLAARAKLDPRRLATALKAAAERSLANFGYLADPAATDAVAVDLEMAFSADRAEGGLDTVVRLGFEPVVEDACLTAVAEGRFMALDRQRSGGGRRAFAVGASVALAFVLVNAGTFLTSELQTASAQNQTINGLRKVAAGEGVSPDFSARGQVRFAAASATQLAFADYIRQLGAAPACKPTA